MPLPGSGCLFFPAIPSWRAGGENLAVVDGGQPVEALGLIHVGRGHNHAHAGAVGADALNQIPELRARQRVHASRRSSRIRKSGS